MEQKVEQEKKEIEFELRPSRKWICEICNRKFSHIEHCRDGKQRCGNCKRKMITNPFYNPDYGKKKNFVGIRNLSGQEMSIQITNLIRQGLNPAQARNRVFNDLRVVRHQKIEKVEPQAISNQNLDIQIKDRTKNKELTQGLGFKEKR